DLKIYIQNQPLGAVDRVKQYFRFRVIKQISKDKGIKKILLPFKIVCLTFYYYKDNIKYRNKFGEKILDKKIPLEYYKDYQKAIEIIKRLKQIICRI
ncbi:glycosyltransferase family 2 protein, partial [Campylobacter coli]|nr:glycosyltransferase family 2 protein [Campylobacter coli]